MKLLITGDISTWNIKNFNIKNFNMDILNVLKSSDTVVYNLEGPIGDFSIGKPIFSEDEFTNTILKKLSTFFKKEQPQVFSDTNILELLKLNPNTIVTLANNHIKDLGLNGYLNTVKLLEENNIKYIGGEKKGEDKSEINAGNSISVLNFNLIGKKYIFDLYGSSKRTFGASSGNLDSIHERVLNAKAREKKVILILHIGKEMVENINEWDIELEEIKKLDADITVIHHPHMYIETEFEKDNIYILGDFLFYRPEKFNPDRKTAVLEIEEINGNLIPRLTKTLVSEIYKY